MTDVETTLRAGLAALAADTEARVTPPPVTMVASRRARPPRRDRWLRVAAGVGAGAAVAAGALATTDTTPGPVDLVLEEFRDAGLRTGEHAERMAVVAGEEGTYELWLSELDGGGYCALVRRVGSDGHGDNVGGRCAGDVALPRTVIGSVPFTTGSGDDLVFGQLPAGFTEVEVTLAGGHSFRVPAQQLGWFVAVAPPDIPDGTDFTGFVPR